MSYVDFYDFYFNNGMQNTASFPLTDLNNQKELYSVTKAN